MKIPLILILDIDATIIGSVSTIEYEHKILTAYKDKKLLSSYDKFLQSYIKEHDIIRPHFIDFINFTVV